MHKPIERRLPWAHARHKLFTAALAVGAVPALVAGQGLLAGAADAAPAAARVQGGQADREGLRSDPERDPRRVQHHRATRP
jgi:hypothetical protein